MNVRLVVTEGARRRVMQLTPPFAVLGRAHGNTVRIPSAEVSRRHCRLLLEDGLVQAEDLDSVNGTFLNGRRLRDVEYVHPGDILQVGPVSFVVEYELTPEARAQLQGGDQGDMLELLADGEVVDAEDLPVLEGLDDDVLPVLEPADEQPMLELADEDEGVVALGEDAPLPADFDLDDGWKMPQGGDLRDLLSQMEDDETPTRHHSPKKRGGA